MVDVAIIAGYVIVGSILAALGIWAMMRKMGSKQATIQDLRNPRAPDQKFYFRPDKRVGLINLYTSLMSPIKAGILPPLDLRPFTYWDGKLYGVRGATGNSEDDSIALLRRPIVSMVECAEQSKSMADAVQRTVEFMNVCSAFTINDEVSFQMMEEQQQAQGLERMNPLHKQKPSEKSTLSGKISNMGYSGLEIISPRQTTEKLKQMNEEGKEVFVDVPKTEYVSYLFPTVRDIAEASITVTLKADNPRPIGLDSFFTPNWIVNNFGVVTVDDVNPILISQKEFIAEFNSRVNDRVNSRKSWIEKNMVAIVLILAIIGLSIAFAIESYAVQEFLNNVIATGVQHINALAVALNASKALTPVG